MDIVALHEQLGQTPDEILSTYPSLTLSDVYAALAYYFDHQQEIQEDLAKDRQLAEEMARSTPSRLRSRAVEYRVSFATPPARGVENDPSILDRRTLR